MELTDIPRMVSSVLLKRRQEEQVRRRGLKERSESWVASQLALDVDFREGGFSGVFKES